MRNSSDKTPESVVKILERHQSEHFPGSAKSMFSDKHGRDIYYAVQVAIGTFSRDTRANIEETFESFYRTSVRDVLENSRTDDEVLEKAADHLVYFDMPEEFQLPVRAEVFALLTATLVAADENGIAISERNGFFEDLNGMGAKVADLVQSKYMGAYTGKYGLIGILNEDDFPVAVDEISISDPRYCDKAGKAYLSLTAREEIQLRGIGIFESNVIERGLK